MEKTFHHRVLIALSLSLSVKDLLFLSLFLSQVLCLPHFCPLLHFSLCPLSSRPLPSFHSPHHRGLPCSVHLSPSPTVSPPLRPSLSLSCLVRGGVLSADRAGRDKVPTRSLKVTAPVLLPLGWGATNPSRPPPNPPPPCQSDGDGEKGDTNWRDSRRHEKRQTGRERERQMRRMERTKSRETN